MNFEKHLEEQLKDEEFKKEWSEVITIYNFVTKEDKSNE